MMRRASTEQRAPRRGPISPARTRAKFCDVLYLLCNGRELEPMLRSEVRVFLRWGKACLVARRFALHENLGACSLERARKMKLGCDVALAKLVIGCTF